MQYDVKKTDGFTISNIIRDNKFMKNVGYVENNPSIIYFFSNENVNRISKKVTELLMGVDCNNRPIIVPNNSILGVMSNILDNYRKETGDIFTRYNIEKNFDISDISNCTSQTIEVIVSDVKNNLEMEQNNSKLSIWTTVLGDFNLHNLRSYAPLKMRNRRPKPMAFNMNY